MIVKKELFVLIYSWLFAPWAWSQSTDLVFVAGGEVSTLYSFDTLQAHVQAFEMDEYLVTNAQFLEFVKTYSKWKKSKVIPLFADQAYLINWPNDTTLPLNLNPKAPVTNISWYSAKAYCESQGKRLPTMNEWEFAAQASETNPNALDDSLFNQRILSGYETPKTYAKSVGSTFKNYWGIYDMHGLVWEWVSDFNSVLISGESRSDGAVDRQLFCASAALVANKDMLKDYAAFMRYAFRGSLKANYCIRNLGFRCANSIQTN